MGKLLKWGFILVIILAGFLFYASKTDFAAFQDRVAVLAKDIRTNKDRPAKYYQWASQLEAEWQVLRQKLVKQPFSESVVKQFDELFEGLMRDIKADMEKAGSDLPQILPQQ